MRSLAQQRLGAVIHMEHPVLKLFEKRFGHLLALLQPFIRCQTVDFAFNGKQAVTVLLAYLDVGQFICRVL